MKNIFLLALFLLAAGTTAQVITPEIPNDLRLPVVFPDGNSGHCVFLYSNRRTSGSFLCQIAQLDAQGQVSKQYPVQELPVVGGDKSFERLCSTSDENGYRVYFRGESVNIYEVSTDRKTLKSTLRLLHAIPEEEEIIGGIEMADKALILSRERISKKDCKLHVYTRAVQGLERRTFAGIPEYFAARKYEPLLVRKDSDLWPDKAINPDKIFADQGKLYLVRDKSPNVFSSDKPVFKYTEIDLSLNTVSIKEAPYPTLGEYAQDSGGGYIYESKLFQVFFDQARFGLRVSSLADGSVLFDKAISGEDTLTLLRSKVNFPGFLTNRKIKTAEKLIRRMGPLYPFVYVKKSQNDLLIGLGGFTVESYGGGGPVMAAGPGGITPSFNSMVYSYEVSTSFYTIMKEDARSLSDRRLDETIFTKINDSNLPDKGSFIRMNGVSTYVYLKKPVLESELKSVVFVRFPGY
ncbi:MAG: hypothetical protein ACK5VB_00750 [Bacteroidota bacterium]